MYSILLKFLKEYLVAHVNAVENQVDYYANGANLDLRVPALLLEPKIDNSDRHSNVWDRGEFHIRIWILVIMDMDVIAAMEEMELILGAEDDVPLVNGDPIEPEKEHLGLKAALQKMRRDPLYEALQGKMGSKRWRIGPEGLRIKGPTFSIQQRTNGTKINVAQLDLYLSTESEH